MNEFAASEWKRAMLSLQSSADIRERDPNSAASRAYYAAFHAVTALFALRNQEFSKHSAVRAALHRSLVHGGEWAKELGQDYDFLMDLRETGDYGGLTHVSADDAEAAWLAAERIMNAVRQTSPNVAVGE